MKTTFSAREARKLTGLPYHKIDRAARNGIVPPSDNIPTGTGDPRRYTLRDLIALRAMKELQDCGVSVPAIKRIVAFLRKMGCEDPVLTRRLIVTGGENPDVLFVDSDAEFVRKISALKSPGQVILQIGALADSVRREAEKEYAQAEERRKQVA